MEVIAVLLDVEKDSPSISLVQGGSLDVLSLKAPLVNLLAALLHVP